MTATAEDVTTRDIPAVGAVASDSRTQESSTDDAVISSAQTPDGIRDSDGKFVRPQARYNSPTYDSPQQDKTFAMQDAPDLSAEDMRALFSGAEKEFSDFTSGGSTASVVHISKDGILTAANVGDSPINIYLRNPKTGAVLHARTISADHQVSNPAEKARIESEGGRVTTDGRGVERVFNEDGARSLMLARSFGSREIKGVSAGPDIAQVDLRDYFKDGNEVIVTTDSDGAFEHTNNTNRAHIIENALDEPHGRKALADALVRHADSFGATDNISSHAIVLDKAPGQNIVMAVFDGHGTHGSAAATLAQKSFERGFDDLKRVADLNARVKAQEAPAEPHISDDLDEGGAFTRDGKRISVAAAIKPGASFTPSRPGPLNGGRSGGAIPRPTSP